jgi:hypothetical protein
MFYHKPYAAGIPVLECRWVTTICKHSVSIVCSAEFFKVRLIAAYITKHIFGTPLLWSLVGVVV